MKRLIAVAVLLLAAGCAGDVSREPPETVSDLAVPCP